jgi:hypothetical protein
MPQLRGPSLLFVCLSFALASHAHGQPPKLNPVRGGADKERAAARVDRYGDPLPEGAVARLGTSRLRRIGGGKVMFSPDGKTLAAEAG